MHDELDALHTVQQDDINHISIPHDQFSSPEPYDLAPHSMHVTAMHPSVLPLLDPLPPSHIPNRLSEFDAPDDIERVLASSMMSQHSSQSPQSSVPSLTSSPVPIPLHPQHPLSPGGLSTYMHSSSSSLASALSPTTSGTGSSQLLNGGSVNTVAASGPGSTSDLSEGFPSPNASLYNGSVSGITSNGNGTPSTAGSFSGSVSLTSSMHDSTASLSSSNSVSSSSSAYSFPTSTGDFNLYNPPASHIVDTLKTVETSLEHNSPTSGSSNRTSVETSRASAAVSPAQNDTSFFSPFLSTLMNNLQIAENCFRSMEIIDFVTKMDESMRVLQDLKQLGVSSHRGVGQPEAIHLAFGNAMAKLQSYSHTIVKNESTSATSQSADIEKSRDLDAMDATLRHMELPLDLAEHDSHLLSSQHQLTVDTSSDGTRKRCASSIAGDRVVKALKREPTDETISLTNVDSSLPIPMSIEISPITLPPEQQPISLPMTISVTDGQNLSSGAGQLPVTDIPGQILVSESQQPVVPSLASSISIPLPPHNQTLSLPLEPSSGLQPAQSSISVPLSSLPPTRSASPSNANVSLPMTGGEFNMNMGPINPDGTLTFSAPFMPAAGMPLSHSSSSNSSHSVPLSAISSVSPSDAKPHTALTVAPIVQSQISAFSSIDSTMSQSQRPTRPIRSASLSYPFDPTSQEYPIPRDFQYRPDAKFTNNIDFNFGSSAGLPISSIANQAHIPQSSQAQISAYGRRASASVSGPMSSFFPNGSIDFHNVSSRTLVSQAPGAVATSSIVSSSMPPALSTYRSPSGSADEYEEGYENGDYDSDGAESGDIWHNPSPTYSNGLHPVGMFGISGGRDGIVPSQSELSRVDIMGQGMHYGHSMETHDRLQSDLDAIFFDFLNRICSNLEATDSKGELIHQTLMAKKMQRLDESPDFRPFKFRIQAFTNAFLEELARRGFPEDKIPMKKVRNYLWNQPYISRFNEDGKKAKSKGNHIWHVDARKKSEGGWEFRPFRRKFAGAPPAVAYVGARWSWTPRIWDPQSARPNVPIQFTSPALPPWLQWVDGTLSGVPPSDAQSCDITVEARFIQDAREEVLSQVFHIAVGNMMQGISTNMETSYSGHVVRRPSLSGDPRRINSDPIVQQASGSVPHFATIPQSISIPPMMTSASVSEVPGQPAAIVNGALENVNQKVHAELISQVGSGSNESNMNIQIEQLVKQKHVLEVTASVMDLKPQVLPPVTQPAKLKAVAEHVVLLATQKVEVEHSNAAVISSFNAGILQPVAPSSLTEISAATETAVAQAVEIGGPLSSEIDVMRIAGTLLEHERALQPVNSLDTVAVNAFPMAPPTRQPQAHMVTY